MYIEGYMIKSFGDSVSNQKSGWRGLALLNFKATVTRHCGVSIRIEIQISGTELRIRNKPLHLQSVDFHQKCQENSVRRK